MQSDAEQPNSELTAFLTTSQRLKQREAKAQLQLNNLTAKLQSATGSHTRFVTICNMTDKIIIVNNTQEFILI